MKSKNIVLIHGWRADISRLNSLKKHLEGLGWKVLLLEIPGFEKPLGKKAWSLDMYSNYAVDEAVKKFKEQEFVMFGHSFGGRCAIKSALIRPKTMKSIVLCSSGGISRPSVLKRYFFLGLSKLGKIFLVHKKSAGNFRKLLYKLAREHDYEKEEILMKDTFKNIVGENLRPWLEKIELPTLILWGGDDKMTPVKDAYFLASQIKDSQINIFPKQGHSLPYLKAKEIAKTIDNWMKDIS